MKKNEYVAPEMEIVEIGMNQPILAGSPDEELPGTIVPGPSDPNDW